MKKEVRCYGGEEVVEVRNDNEQDTRKVSGYALVFNRLSVDLGGFKEKIEPTSLEGVIATSDVLCWLNHDERRGLLARSNKGKGSLTLEIDEKGLKYTFDAPNTALGDELLEGIKRGDISQSSFAFTVKDEEWEKQSDGTYIRTIKKIERLFDVSPVYTPAYNDTSVALRSIEMYDTKTQVNKEYYNNLYSEIR